MASKLPPIERPNYAAIASMDGGDLLRVREYYIVRIVTARRLNDSDTLAAAIDWLVALTGEMRLRGNDAEERATVIA